MKNTIRKLIGEKRFQEFRACVLTVQYGYKRKIDTAMNYRAFSIKNRHVFFGYYDIPQFSVDEKTLLVHVVDKKARPVVDDAEIGCFDIESGEYKRICTTKTWCWQQGARLRWHPLLNDHILYNDCENGSYVARVFDTNLNTIVATYPRALYDVAHDFSYGLSLNFSRLQRLRPGYGYNRLPDDTENIAIPDNDGVFYIDLSNGEVKLIVSLELLAKDSPDVEEYQHYINHISIAPDDTHFTFFHIKTKAATSKWTTTLYSCNRDGSELKIIEDRYKVSHYCWKNSEEIIVTCYEGNKQFYELINIKTGAAVRFAENKLNVDGHPSYYANETQLITDTYPGRDCMQRIFMFNNVANTDGFQCVAKLYHDPFMNGEKRCDLHPRVLPSGKQFCVDTTCHGKVRECVLFGGKK